jgi:hypothetical protein
VVIHVFVRTGSCWAFSSTGAMEGAHAIATGELVSLSEQELVSCSHRNFGCHGGLMDPAFKWVMKNGGINTEDGYPYVSGDGHSKLCKWLLVRFSIIDLLHPIYSDFQSMFLLFARFCSSVGVVIQGLDAGFSSHCIVIHVFCDLFAFLHVNARVTC